MFQAAGIDTDGSLQFVGDAPTDRQLAQRLASPGRSAKLIARSSGITDSCCALSGRPRGKSPSAARLPSSASVALTVLNVKPNGLGFVTLSQMRTDGAANGHRPRRSEDANLGGLTVSLLETRRLDDARSARRDLRSRRRTLMATSSKQQHVACRGVCNRSARVP